MKPFLPILAGSVLLLSASCSSTRTASTYDDDVYNPVVTSQPAPDRTNTGSNDPYDYSEQNAVDQNSSQEYYDPNATTTETYTDGNGDTYITNNFNGNNNSFNYDDYYDYAYSARIRRFHNPVVTYSYYDPFYTNNYWYSYDPYYWGTSIYVGYSWWNPRPWRHWGWGVSWGYGWGSGWGYGWGSPYYGWNNWGYGGYWNGYNHGYWNGYNDGYYSGIGQQYYYNSYDSNTHYYGHRGSSTGSGSGITTRGDRSLGQIYESAAGLPTRSGDNGSVRQIPSTGSTGIQTNNNQDTRSPGNPAGNQNAIQQGSSGTRDVGSNPAVTRPGDNQPATTGRPASTTPATKEVTRPSGSGRPAGTPSEITRPQTPVYERPDRINSGSQPATVPGGVRSPSQNPSEYTRPQQQQPQVTPRQNVNPQNNYQRPLQPVQPQNNQRPQQNNNYSRPQQTPRANTTRPQSAAPQERTVRPQNNNSYSRPSSERPAVNYNRPNSRPQYNYNKPQNSSPSRGSGSFSTPSRSSGGSISSPSRGSSSPSSRPSSGTRGPR